MHLRTSTCLGLLAISIAYAADPIFSSGYDRYHHHRAKATRINKRKPGSGVPSSHSSSSSSRFRSPPPSTTSSSSLPVYTPTTSPQQSINVSTLWQVHLYDQWFSAASLVSDETSYPSTLTAMSAGGDWTDAPYPFFIVSGQSDSDPSTNGWTWNLSSDLPPGSVWPIGGNSPYAGYTGIDFSTFGTTAAIFTPTNSLPIYATSFPPITDNPWETGPATAISYNGSIAAVGVTLLASRNPDGTKHAYISAFTVEEGDSSSSSSSSPSSSSRTLVSDSFPNATGFEEIRMTSDGSLLVAIAANQETDGSIHSSTVRIYDVLDSGEMVVQVITPYVYAACLSPDGSKLVLATTDSVDTIEVYSLTAGAGGGSATLLVNSSYPSSLPGTFQYVAGCRISNAGVMMATFAIFWGDAMNQTIVAQYSLPTTTISPPLLPNWVYFSTPVSPSLQDGPQVDSMSSDGTLYAYTSWGGQAINTTTGTVPPTFHLFSANVSQTAPSAPLLEIVTTVDNITSASLQEMDMAMGADGNLRVIAAGQDGHANIGSDGGGLYMWMIEIT